MVEPNRPGGIAEVAYACDLDGNRTKGGVCDAYLNDHENRLVELALNTASVGVNGTYRYA